MTLDETQQSLLDDDAIRDEISATAYGSDNRPAWIGAHRPATNSAELKQLCAWAATHYAFYLTFVREFMERRGAVLDLGSGAGHNTAMLARYAESALGVELDNHSYWFAMKHNRTSGAAFLNAEFPCPTPHAFDYIFCVETIEHVEYDKQEAFVQGALNILAPDGRLFITTPNETSASAPHRGIWTPEWLEKISGWFGARVVKRGYFDNQRPEVGFVEPTGSHHAWVMR